MLCPNLIELDLSGNELSDPGAETLSFALLSGTAGGEDAHRHINTLSGAASTIAQAKLADPKARAVLRKWKCSLRSLSLNSNHIRVRGTRALAIAAARSSSLRYLSLADNPIGDDGAAALAAALAPETQPVIETVAPTWDRSAAMELLDLGMRWARPTSRSLRLGRRGLSATSYILVRQTVVRKRTYPLRNRRHVPRRHLPQRR